MAPIDRRILYPPATHEMDLVSSGVRAVSNLFGEVLSGSSTESQDRFPLPSESSEGAERATEDGRAGNSRFDEVRQLQTEMGGLKGQLERQAAEMARLRAEREELRRECKNKEYRIVELIRENGSHREHAQRQAQHILAAEEGLKQTEEILATRSAELAGAEAFLSTTDRISEAEVLGIVRDLNESIYQVAVNLTEEWEKPQSSQDINPMDRVLTSQPDFPLLVQQVHNRNSTVLTFLFQSCLCSEVATMTSRWARHPELAMLGSIHHRLSSSGEHRVVHPATHDSYLAEGQAISARWRSLTHTYLSLPPPRSAPLVERLVNVLDEIGSFSSKQESLELVEGTALKGIESIIRSALRLEYAFMVEVMSSDMSLLFETPGTAFDGARMASEFESNGAQSTDCSRGDTVAGVTELGVGKRACGGPAEPARVSVLLKTKVVLERDVAAS